MIKTFKNKQLAKLWEDAPSKIDARFHARIIERLNALDDAAEPDDMNVPGYKFHGLRGRTFLRSACRAPTADGTSRTQSRWRHDARRLPYRPFV